MNHPKFKAWDKIAKVMIPSVAVYPNGSVGFDLDIYYDTYSGDHLDILRNDTHLTTGDDWIWILDPKYVDILQYTGSKERNKKEMYKGDILDLPLYPEHLCRSCGSLPAQIVFIEGRFMLKGVNGDLDDLDEIYNPGLYQPAIGEGHKTTVEIIGNIYENPELMKEWKDETDES